MLSIVGYVRISKDEEGSRSLETQEHAIRAWAEREGHRVLEIHRDDGISGSVPPMERAGARAAVERARRRDVDALVISKLDRIARDLRSTLDLVDNVLGRRAALISLAESFDATTAFGRASLQFMGMFAELERNRIRERTREALETRRRRGLKTGGTVPFGWSVGEGRRLFPNGDEQRVLNRAFELRSQGVSWRKAAAQLNEEECHRREGRPWTFSVLRAVLMAEERRREAMASAEVLT